ncbi:MAG TPA: PatB family C-S lyase [Phycisphaerae bacterium]|nr:PatB family C-S lyase [Phycisphaerae bacterium]
MSYDFDAVVDRRHSDSVKWDRYKGRDVIPMWVADMDFRCAPEILAALHRVVDHGVFGYAHAPDGLTACLLRRLRERYGWTVEAEHLVWLPDLGAGLHLACRAAGDEGDQVLVMPPIYPPFLAAPKRSGRQRLDVPLSLRNGRWAMDLDAVARAITPRTRAVLLCNPHNPVGRLYTAEELRGLMDLCRRHDLVVCSDEVHAELTLDADLRHVPTAMLSADAAARTITLLSASKTFNVPGLRCAVAVIADEGLRRRFRGAFAGLVSGGNPFGYAASLAAWRDAEPWRLALVDYLRGNRDLVERAIADTPPLAMTHVEATYLAWIDARALCADNPAALFEEAGVGLMDGKEFGAPGYVRLNFGCPRSLLREALDRIGRAVGGGEAGRALADEQSR